MARAGCRLRAGDVIGDQGRQPVHRVDGAVAVVLGRTAHEDAGVEFVQLPLGWDRAAREELRETVRRAVAGATSTDEFLERLKDAGLLVRTRVLPSGDVKGYNVALPGDRNRDKEPIYYAGSTLAPDLSLPRIQARFTTDSTPPGTADSERPERSTASSAPAAARRTTAHAAWAAVLVLDHNSDDGASAAQIAATGEVLDALAKTSALHTRNQLRQAAWEFERASRSHTRAEFRHAQNLRRSARDLVNSGPALGRGEDGAGTAMVLDTLVFLAIAAAHWHAQRQHAQQAEAARRAAAHLRAAYQQAAAEPLTALRERSRRIAPSLRRHHATTVRAALSELAETILAEPGWDALAAPSPTPHGQATTRRLCSPKLPLAGNWTPPIPSATSSSGACVARPTFPPTPRPRIPRRSVGSRTARAWHRTSQYLRHHAHRAADPDEGPLPNAPRTLPLGRRIPVRAAGRMQIVAAWMRLTLHAPS